MLGATIRSTVPEPLPELWQQLDRQACTVSQ